MATQHLDLLNFGLIQVGGYRLHSSGFSAFSNTAEADLESGA